MQVKGFPGSKHKKFKGNVDAAQWLSTHGVAVDSHVQAAAASSSTSSGSSPTARPAPRSTNAKGKAKASSSGSLFGKDVIEDTTGWQIVYCDGACPGNGQPGAVAGVGVWFGEGDPRYAVSPFTWNRRPYLCYRNIAERCPGDQTNNRAELIVCHLLFHLLGPR